MTRKPVLVTRSFSEKANAKEAVTWKQVLVTRMFSETAEAKEAVTRKPVLVTRMFSENTNKISRGTDIGSCGTEVIL